LFEGEILTIGINGWLPGGKEWPTILTFRQIGGSSSSFRASSNLFLVCFIDPSKVLFMVFFILEDPLD
jgi:hypothetical protein